MTGRDRKRRGGARESKRNRGTSAPCGRGGGFRVMCLCLCRHMLLHSHSVCGTHEHRLLSYNTRAHTHTPIHANPARTTSHKRAHALAHVLVHERNRGEIGESIIPRTCNREVWLYLPLHCPLPKCCASPVVARFVYYVLPSTSYQHTNAISVRDACRS